MTWVEERANEKKIGKVDGPQPDPKKKQGWVPKYTSIGDILAEYGGGEPQPETSPVSETEIAALVAELEDQAEAEF